MTYFVRADNLISLLLVSSDIFHYLCSLFLCLTSAVFTTALCSPENRRQVLLCKYTQSLTVFRTGGCGKTDNRVANFINKSFFLFFFLNLYKELIRNTYYPGALVCCSCAHWLGLPPGSPSPNYSRCFITVLPHLSQYNYELHLLLGTKQSLELEITITNGFMLTDYKL